MTKRSLKEPPPEEQPFLLRGYVVINLSFYLFLLLVLWVAYWLQNGDVAGLIPVLILIAACFTLVSLYDAVFDRALFRRWRSGQERGDESDDDSPSRTPTASTTTATPAPKAGPAKGAMARTKGP